MMSGQISSKYFDGTSAVEMRRFAKATIIEFPSNANTRPKAGSQAALRAILRKASSHMADILNASEMFCSLKFEDFLGCSYGIFSKRASSILAAVAAAIAITAIALGA